MKNDDTPFWKLVLVIIAVNIAIGLAAWAIQAATNSPDPCGEGGADQYTYACGN